MPHRDISLNPTVPYEAAVPLVPPVPFKIVGFDLDGTLLDTAEDLRHALNHTLAVAGRRAVTSPEARALIGGGTRQMLNRAMALTGGMPAEGETERLAGILVEYYEAHIAEHTVMFPGGAAMLDGLAARGVRLAIVTNKLERLALRLFDSLGLSSRFYTIIGGDSLGPGKAKPAPDLLFEMVRRSGLSGADETPRAAYIGDTSFDTRAARAAGMPCVVASFGFNDAPAETLGADAVIDHFEQLIPTLAVL